MGKEIVCSSCDNTQATARMLISLKGDTRSYYLCDTCIAECVMIVGNQSTGSSVEDRLWRTAGDLFSKLEQVEDLDRKPMPANDVS